MKNNKKLLSLAMFILVMNGCATYHTNVIKNVADTSILVEDVDNKQERIVKVHDTKYQKTMLSCLQAGDTVWIKSPFYENSVLEPDNRTVICFDGDTIDARMQQKRFAETKRAMLSTKTR